METEKTIDKEIEKAFKILEDQINKKHYLCKPKKYEQLGKMTELIIAAMSVFQTIKSQSLKSDSK